MSFGKNPSFVLNLLGAKLRSKEGRIYRFKSFRLVVAERRLLHKNKNIPPGPKAFDVLALLVENGGHLVEKNELLSDSLD